VLTQCTIVQYFANLGNARELFSIDLYLTEEDFALRSRAELLGALDTQSSGVIWLFFASYIENLRLFVKVEQPTDVLCNKQLWHVLRDEILGVETRKLPQDGRVEAGQWRLIL